MRKKFERRTSHRCIASDDMPLTRNQRGVSRNEKDKKKSREKRKKKRVTVIWARLASAVPHVAAIDRALCIYIYIYIYIYMYIYRALYGIFPHYGETFPESC